MSSENEPATPGVCKRSFSDIGGPLVLYVCYSDPSNYSGPVSGWARAAPGASGRPTYQPVHIETIVEIEADTAIEYGRHPASCASAPTSPPQTSSDAQPAAVERTMVP